MWQTHTAGMPCLCSNNSKACYSAQCDRLTTQYWLNLEKLELGLASEKYNFHQKVSL